MEIKEQTAADRRLSENEQLEKFRKEVFDKACEGLRDLYEMAKADSTKRKKIATEFIYFRVVLEEDKNNLKCYSDLLEEDAEREKESEGVATEKRIGENFILLTEMLGRLFIKAKEGDQNARQALISISETIETKKKLWKGK